MKNHHRLLFVNILFLLVITLSLIIIPSLKTYSITDLNQSSVGVDFVYHPMQSVTKEDALNALIGSEYEIKKLKQAGLTTYFVNDTLFEAKKYYVGKNLNELITDSNLEKDEIKKVYLKSLIDFYPTIQDYEKVDVNYTQVIFLYQLINYTRKEALNSLDSISLLEDKIESYRTKGVSVTTAAEIVDKAKESFNLERYNSAKVYLSNADSLLEEGLLDFKRHQFVTELSKNFFEKYWTQLIIGLFLIIILTPICYIQIRKHLAIKKLRSLNIEISSLNNLLKQSQIECFKEGKISENTYKIRSDFYKDKISEIKRTIPVLESIIKHKKNK